MKPDNCFKGAMMVALGVCMASSVFAAIWGCKIERDERKGVGK